MAKLAPTQIEQLQGIGAYLRQVRQQQGLPVEAVANQIFIRPALLQALEEGQGAELPEAVFIQGFIRRYAEALGLDGQAIAQEFQVTPTEVISAPDLLQRVDETGAVAPASVAVKVAQPPMPSPAPRHRQSGGNPWPLLGLLALATLGGLGLWAWARRSPAPAPTVEAPAEPTVDEAEAVAEPEAVALEPLEVARPTPEAPVVASVNVSDRAWLSVVADGTNVYEGLAEVGFEETWTAQDSLVFTTGNAGGVELSVNGDRPVVVGGNGAVRTLTLTPESGVEAVQSP